MPPSISRSIARPEASIQPRIFSHLGKTLSMKAWPPKPGFTLITSTLVDFVDHGTDLLGRRARVDHHASGFPELVDLLDGAVEVGAGLGVHADSVGALARVVGDRAFRFLDHQVHVEGAIGGGRDRGQERRPDRQVRHEVPVHHVDVDPVGAGLAHEANLFRESAEVAGQDGGRDLDLVAHECSRLSSVSGSAAHG